MWRQIRCQILMFFHYLYYLLFVLLTGLVIIEISVSLLPLHQKEVF